MAPSARVRPWSWIQLKSVSEVRNHQGLSRAQGTAAPNEDFLTMEGGYDDSTTSGTGVTMNIVVRA